MENLTVLQACDFLESLIGQLSLEAVSNRWQPGYYEEKSDEDHAAGFLESLQKTREFHGTDGPQRAHGVFLQDKDILLGVTGTSPTSAARAEYIAALDPTVVSQLINYIRQKENECSK